MTTRRPRVLLIEDSATVAAVVRYSLEREGFGVVLAADGAQGLALARRERPDVVITDLELPGLGGLDLIDALRAEPETAGVAVLLMSADPEDEGQRHGADVYLVKPVEPRRLAVHVRGLVERRESGRAGAIAP